MAKKEEAQNEAVEFERMPGSEEIEKPEDIDLNFGLGEEELLLSDLEGYTLKECPLQHP